MAEAAAIGVENFLNPVNDDLDAMKTVQDGQLEAGMVGADFNMYAEGPPDNTVGWLLKLETGK